jgi:hypothetical protein
VLPSIRSVTDARNRRKVHRQEEGREGIENLIVAHTTDLGGVAALSEAQRSLVRRAAGLECELEQMEGRLSLGEAVSLDEFGRATSHLRRLLETLGLERKARDVTPDGVEVEVFSPMRARWAAEAAKHGAETTAKVTE